MLLSLGVLSPGQSKVSAQSLMSTKQEPSSLWQAEEEMDFHVKLSKLVGGMGCGLIASWNKYVGIATCVWHLCIFLRLEWRLTMTIMKLSALQLTASSHTCTGTCVADSRLAWCAYWSGVLGDLSTLSVHVPEGYSSHFEAHVSVTPDFG